MENENNLIECYECLNKFNENELTYLSNYDRYVCNECLDNNYTRCDRCSEIIHNDDVYRVNNYDVYCEDCFSNCTTSCHNCGEYYTDDYLNYCEDDDYYYCDSCYDEYEHSDIIKSYHHRDIPITYKYLPSEVSINISPDDLLYFGVELEVQNKENNISNNEMAHLIRSKFRELDLVFEEDGSVSNGFEIITEPMTMLYIKEHKNDFKDMLELLDSKGFASHNTNCCGLHIHFSRNYFKDNEDKYLQKLGLFFEQNKTQLQAFSRRTSFNWCNWTSDYCSINDKYKNVGLLIKDSMKRSASHNIAINTGNSNTIEIRIFRGTLRYETYMASIELVDSLVRAIKTKPNGKISFNSIINDSANEFIQDYCRSKDIFNSATIVDDTREVFKNLKNKLDRLKNIDREVENVSSMFNDDVLKLLNKYTNKLKKVNSKYSKDLLVVLKTLNNMLINQVNDYEYSKNIKKRKKSSIYEYDNYSKYLRNSYYNYSTNFENLSNRIGEIYNLVNYTTFKDTKIVETLNNLRTKYKDMFDKIKKDYDSVLSINNTNGGEQ